jgi:hypothetical protein
MAIGRGPRGAAAAACPAHDIQIEPRRQHRVGSTDRMRVVKRRQQSESRQIIVEARD